MTPAAPPGEIEIIATSGQSVSAPAFRVRLALLAPGLRDRGVRMDLAPLFDEPGGEAWSSGGPAAARAVLGARPRLRDRLDASRAGTVIVQRRVDVLPSLALERRAAHGRRLILDVDDAVWISGREAGGHPLAALKGGGRKTRWLAERADLVVTGNAALADRFERWNAHVAVVPSMIDVEAVPVREHDDGPEVVLGWIGSRTTAPYLHRIAADLDEFAAGDPGRVRLVVVGGDAPRLRNAHVEQIRWSPDAEQATLKRMDVGLMPLPDNEWTRGKCAYKALQYMAAGVPVIADDVGVSAAVVGDEVGGFVVPRGASWVAPLRELARDPALRGRMGASARRRIAEEYSTLRWLPELARLLRSA